MQNIASLFSGGSAPQTPSKSAWRPQDPLTVPNAAAGKNVYTSRLSGRPNFRNDHVYQFPASESLNLLFVQSVGEEASGRGQKGTYILHVGVAS